MVDFAGISLTAGTAVSLLVALVIGAVLGRPIASGVGQLLSNAGASVKALFGEK